VYMQKIGPWAPFIFIVCFVLSIIFFIPASVFTSIGGLLFGSWAGLLLNFVAVNIGGVFSFLAARYLLRDAASKILQKGHFKKLDDKVAEHGFSIMIYLRLMFVPFTYLSFASGLSKIKFRDFFWGTLIGVVPGMVVITFLAVAVKKLLVSHAGPADFIRPDIIFPVLLFGFSFFIPSIIKHFKNKFYVTVEPEEETGNQM
ncbi:MAG TPA: VTT domain-containing protein, partial [Candidatus Goldiibacteriota bacterium]|nr:VTT domain-containing protein [Candidatus Goldiibacteriota bacterium]